MKLWKVTDSDGRTRNGMQWGEGVTNTADGKATDLCNCHWLHAYQDPLLAAFIYRTHTSWRDPRLWEADGDVGLEHADKVGCTRLTTLREVPFPEITTEQRVRFAILCALAVYPICEQYDKEGVWKKWADAYLSGSADADACRAADAADAAAAAAWRAADAAWRAAADAKNIAKLDLVALAHKAMEAK